MIKKKKKKKNVTGLHVLFLGVIIKAGSKGRESGPKVESKFGQSNNNIQILLRLPNTFSCFRASHIEHIQTL